MKSYYLSVDRAYPKFKESDIDFRYLSDAMPKKPFYPAALCKFININSHSRTKLPESGGKWGREM